MGQGLIEGPGCVETVFVFLFSCAALLGALGLLFFRRVAARMENWYEAMFPPAARERIDAATGGLRSEATVITASILSLTLGCLGVLAATGVTT